MEDEPELITRIQQLALKIHKTMHLRDFSLMDFRIDALGQPWLLEVNLFCSFGSKSILSIQAEASFQWSHAELFEIMLKNVQRRSRSLA